LDDSWYEILKVTNRKKIAGKPHFLVHWLDGSKTYKKGKVSDFVKAQYYARYQSRLRPHRCM